MNWFAPILEWDYILFFFLFFNHGFVAIKELQTICMDSKPMKRFQVLLRMNYTFLTNPGSAIRSNMQFKHHSHVVPATV